MTKEIIFLTIGGIIGFASSFFMWKIQVGYEQKKYCQSIYSGNILIGRKFKDICRNVQQPST
jgi:hypothetical protein